MSGFYLTRTTSNDPLLLGENSEITAIVLLARRLKADSPDAKHPGKAEKNTREESSLSLRVIFFGFLGPEALILSYLPAAGESCLIFSNKSIRLMESRGRRPLVQGFRGTKP